MRNGLLVTYEEADEIRELLIRDALYIQEQLDVTSLDLRHRLNVDLSGPDGERLYFKIEVRGSDSTPPPPSPRLKQE